MPVEGDSISKSTSNITSTNAHSSSQDDQQQHHHHRYNTRFQEKWEHDHDDTTMTTDQPTNGGSGSHYQVFYSAEHQREFYVQNDAQKTTTWFAPNVTLEIPPEEEDDESNWVDTPTHSASTGGDGRVWTWLGLYVVGLLVLTWMRLAIPMEGVEASSSPSPVMELVLKPFQPTLVPPVEEEDEKPLTKRGKLGRAAGNFLFTPFVLLLRDDETTEL